MLFLYSHYCTLCTYTHTQSEHTTSDVIMWCCDVMWCHVMLLLNVFKIRWCIFTVSKNSNKILWGSSWVKLSRDFISIFLSFISHFLQVHFFSYLIAFFSLHTGISKCIHICGHSFFNFWWNELLFMYTYL